MPQVKNYILILLLAMLGAGCTGSRVSSSVPSDSSLDGPVWGLVSFGEAADARPTLGDIHITVSFSADSRVAGAAGCNRYFGNYTAEGDNLTIAQVGSTLMACPPPVMERERAYLTALDAVRGWTRDGDQLSLTDASGKALLIFERKEPVSTLRMEPQPTGQTSVFECTDPENGDFSFTVRTGPGELALWLPERFGGRYLVLGQVRAASEARYKGDGIVVWNKGNEASLSIDGETFTGCTKNPRRAVWEEAKRRGMDFRAIGQEPGWHLEIRDGERIRFVYAYGEHKVTVPAPEPTVDPAARQTIYHATTGAHDLTATITATPCTDIMSGEAFEHAVTVLFDGETYQGCGRDL